VNPANALRLLALSALWGGSFPFMRVAVPSLGPVWLITVRVALAALFLWLVGRALQRPRLERRHFGHFMVLGLINSGLPFVLFAFAAQTVTASMLAVLNATAPIWAALIGAFWHGTRLHPRQVLGMALGVAGVALLAGVEALQLPPGGWVGILAALAAPLCYGISATYVRRAPEVPSFSNAHGSMWAASLWLLPLAAFTPMPAADAAAGVAAGAASSTSALVIGSVLMLGIACSGVAYLLHFRLVSELGPAPALSVTFLIPVFGIFWGAVFLGEVVGWHTLAGTAIVLAGTALVTGFRWQMLRLGAAARGA
jgi:drug/metabolite transporter (DMT)-like permease